MQVEARVTLPALGGQEHAVIESGIAGVWVSEPKTIRQGGDIVAVSQMVHPDGGVFSIDRSAIRITIIGGQSAVDLRGCSAG